MVKFGDENFSIVIFNKVDVSDVFEYEFDIVANGKSICSQIRGNKVVNCKCNILLIRDWFMENLNSICNDPNFPLDVVAENAMDFYIRSGEIDFEDDVEFDAWYITRQDWYFKHSLLSADSGSFLSDVLFFCKAHGVEISWDSTHLFEGIEFLNPKGCEMVDSDKFKFVVESFIKSDYFEVL